MNKEKIFMRLKIIIRQIMRGIKKISFSWPFNDECAFGRLQTFNSDQLLELLITIKNDVLYEYIFFHESLMTKYIDDLFAFILYYRKILQSRDKSTFKYDWFILHFSITELLKKSICCVKLFFTQTKYLQAIWINNRKKKFFVKKKKII